MKRQRGRGRKPGGGGGGGGNHHNHGNRSLESNGPDVKIRGTAAQIYEKYAQFARDAQSGGDRVKYETYLQHAEHYYRVMAATMPRERLLQQQNGEGGFQQGQPMGEGGQQQPNDGAPSGAHGSMPGGEHTSGGMRSMDEASPDSDEGDDDVEAADVSRSQYSGAQSSGTQSSAGRPSDSEDAEASGEDGDRQGQGDADGNGRGRRRRGRRRHQDGDRPNAATGGNTGGDTEARSALDSLARKQGALAGG